MCVCVCVCMYHVTREKGLTWEEGNVLEGYWAAYKIHRNTGEAGRNQGSQVASTVAKLSTEEQPGQGDAAPPLTLGMATSAAITRHWILLRRRRGCVLLLALMPSNAWCRHHWNEFSLPPSLCHLLQIQSPSRRVWLAGLRSLICIQLSGSTRVSIRFSQLTEAELGPAAAKTHKTYETFRILSLRNKTKNDFAIENNAFLAKMILCFVLAYNMPSVVVIIFIYKNFNENINWAAPGWLSQVKRPTLAQVMTSRFRSLSPVSRSVLTARSLEPISDLVSPSLSLPLSHSCFVSFSLSQKWINVKKLKQGRLGGSVG